MPAARIFSSSSEASSPSSYSPSSSWIALSFWRNTASRWCLENSSRTCVSIFSLTSNTCTRCCSASSTRVSRLVTSSSPSSARRSSVDWSRFAQAMSARREGSRIASITPPFSSGISGESAITCLHVSRTAIASPSASGECALVSSSGSTSAARYGDRCAKVPRRRRSRPRTTTVMRDSDSLTTFRISASTAISNRSSGFGSSICGSFCVAINRRAGERLTTSSISLSEPGRPTSTGSTTPGKSTRFRSGRTGREATPERLGSSLMVNT